MEFISSPKFISVNMIRNVTECLRAYFYVQEKLGKVTLWVKSLNFGKIIDKRTKGKAGKTDSRNINIISSQTNNNKVMVLLW